MLFGYAADAVMVWTSPARHLAQGRAVPRWLSLKQHLKERRLWESLSSICHLSRPLGSIWPSTSFKFTALMLRGALLSPRRSGATSCWSSSLRCRLAWWGFEASGSAHHWARELMALGHEARMPPAYVKPYIRRQKNDASDAAAICEAVTRPSMRFVACVRWRTRRR